MSDWFVDKLGPQPKNPAPMTGSGLPKANSSDSLTPPARPGAAPQQAKGAPAPQAKAAAPQRAAPPPPPEPEPPKKKKGWF